MSRSKKSRKPGGAPTAKPKLSKQELASVEKRIRKTTGKVAGNRQKEASPKQVDKQQQDTKKDPRLGNKTPISLGKKVATPERAAGTKESKNSQPIAPIASVRFVEQSERETASQQEVLVKQALTPEQALNAIEQDEVLQSILAKQEDDIALTEQEVDYFNDMMERHQILSTELGLDDTEELSEDDEPMRSENEDDLWDKLDNHDLSDFQDEAKE
ncbi:MAG: Der GTPase-activating protein YihI [Colwellia sp.]